MLQTLNSILRGFVNFIKIAFSSVYLPVTLAVIGVILGVLYFNSNKNLELEKAKSEREKNIALQNYKAQSDSIRVYYDEKTKREVSEKTSLLIKSVDDLKQMNKELYNEFKDTKGVIAGIKSDVTAIIPKLTSKGEKPTVDSTDSTKFTIPFKFNYSDEGIKQNIIGNTTLRILKGKPVDPIVSTLDSNTFNIKLKYSVSDVDGKYIVSASSQSKIVKFNTIDNFISIDKVVPPPVKINPWCFGPYIGFGLNTDLVGTNSRFGWSVGVGLSYNILSRIKK